MPTVGIIGSGVMGSAFATNLLSKGYEAHVYNRTRERAQPLVEKGAIPHSTPRELASRVDIVLTSLTDHTAIDSVAFGSDGFLDAMKKGCLWIDLSTIDPRASVRHSEAARRAGIKRLDAPVVGSREAAARGELVILVGGSEQVFGSHESFLKELGKTVLYLGGDGSGHRMKLVINLYLGLAAESFSEVLVLARKLGFDAKTFVETFNRTPHRSYFSEGKGPKIAEGNFEPAFSLDNLLKDLKLADEQAEETGALLPVSKVAMNVYVEAAKDGHGKRDFSVVALELERKNGLAEH
jgi:3-hydroxyisobutyrate dehydrogenase-like beta-hydroxyacid dehydrogenase